MVDLRACTDVPTEFLQPHRILLRLAEDAVEAICKLAVDYWKEIGVEGLIVEALEVANGLLVTEDGHHAA